MTDFVPMSLLRRQKWIREFFIIVSKDQINSVVENRSLANHTTAEVRVLNTCGS